MLDAIKTVSKVFLLARDSLKPGLPVILQYAK